MGVFTSPLSERKIKKWSAIASNKHTYHLDAKCYPTSIMLSCNISVLFYKQDFQLCTDAFGGTRIGRGTWIHGRELAKKPCHCLSLLSKRTTTKWGAAAHQYRNLASSAVIDPPQQSLGRGGRNHRNFTQICLHELFYSQAETCPVHPPFWNCHSSEALSILLSTSTRLHQPSPSISSWFLYLVSWAEHPPKKTESSQHYKECK